MRIPPLPALVAGALTGLAAPALAQTVEIDTYWQRESGAETFDEMAPFRSPSGVKGNIPGQLRDLMTDLTEMRRLAANANKLQLRIDEDGREICAIKAWGTAYENVKANSLKMAGWLGVVMRNDESILKRRTAIYGMVYFNDPQQVIELISMLPGEPMRDLRQDGFQRGINFLSKHYHKSKPQNPKFDNGIVVPRYKFNPLPFFLLLEKEDPLDQAQALWFLTEVLRIRPDMGKVYLEELWDRIPELLLSENPLVRQSATEFLGAIDRKRDRVKRGTASNAELEKWLKDLEYDLFPPIRHLSLGLVELHPSDDRDAVVKVGKNILVDSMLPRASTKTKSGAVRYGVRIARLPAPLDKLGLPRGAVIVGINGQPVRDAADLKRILTEYFKQFEPKKGGKKDEEDKLPKRTPAVQVEYIHKKKALLKEYRVIQ